MSCGSGMVGDTVVRVYKADACNILGPMTSFRVGNGGVALAAAEAEAET